MRINALRHVVFVFAVANGISVASAAPTSYLCALDEMTGFSYDKSLKQWHATNFRASKKFILSRSKQQKFAWEVTEVGSTLPGAACEKDFNESGNIFCTGLFELRFNRNQLRFLYFHAIGYWNDDNSSDLFKEGSNTPAIGIGKCSPL